MFAQWLKDFADWRARREAVRSLTLMDDRLLVDMGTTRPDIGSFVAAKAAEQQCPDGAAMAGALRPFC